MLTLDHWVNPAGLFLCSVLHLCFNVTRSQYCPWHSKRLSWNLSLIQHITSVLKLKPSFYYNGKCNSLWEKHFPSHIVKLCLDIFSWKNLTSYMLYCQLCHSKNTNNLMLYIFVRMCIWAVSHCQKVMMLMIAISPCIHHLACTRNASRILDIKLTFEFETKLLWARIISQVFVFIIFSLKSHFSPFWVDVLIGKHLVAGCCRWRKVITY